MNSIVDFFHLIQQLKTQKRTGWLKSGISIADAESISDHMYRMAMICMTLPDEIEFKSIGKKTIDKQKCVMMALVHDLAESKVGDITPHCGITKEEKQRMEAEAMSEIAHVISTFNPESANNVEQLFQEYEDKITPESLLLHDVDKFEMVLQADEYSKKFPSVDLSQFFTSTVGIYQSDLIDKWDQEVRQGRK